MTPDKNKSFWLYYKQDFIGVRRININPLRLISSYFYILVFLSIIFLLFYALAQNNPSIWLGFVAYIVSSSGAYIAFRQFKIARTYNILDRFVDNEFRKAKNFIELDAKSYLLSLRIDQIASALEEPILTDGKRYKFTNKPSASSSPLSFATDKLTHFYDEIGTLLNIGNIDEDVIMSIMGRSIIEDWIILGHIVNQQHHIRVKRRKEAELIAKNYISIQYGCGFYYLFCRASRWRPTKSMERMSYKNYFHGGV